MRTIRLGPEPDCIELEIGTSVPMSGGAIPGGHVRGVLRLVNGIPCIEYSPNPELPKTVSSFNPVDGRLHSLSPRVIDLPAVRREFGSNASVCRQGMPRRADEIVTLESIGALIKSPLAQTWVHRPGNTPEKQAEFDDALNDWVDGKDEVVEGARALDHYLGTGVEKLYDAARALGYGRALPRKPGSPTEKSAP